MTIHNKDSSVLAVFDLDGTLVRGDCFLPFVISYARSRGKYKTLLSFPIHAGMYAIRLTRDNVAKERILISLLKGERKSTVAEHAIRFCETWVKPRLKPNVIERLRIHQASNHRVILLSASPEIYVEQIAQFLGIPEVICTRVKSEGEFWNGQLHGKNCKGEEKLNAIIDYLGIKTWTGESISYGDSKSDLPVLRWATKGFLVGRQDELFQV